MKVINISRFENSTSNKKGSIELNVNYKLYEKFLQLICDKVIHVLEIEEMYKVENLSIDQLAETIGYRPYLVSKAVNSLLKKSFVTLVNEYRVKEVIRLMGSPSHSNLTLLGIAFESGFTSKTTFNTQFKKITGQTPRQYKKTTICPLIKLSIV